MIRNPTYRKTLLKNVTGPLTAREAFEFVRPVASSDDPDACFYSLTCGERITHEGTADLWEFLFNFPNARARAIFGVGIDENCDPDEEWHLRYLFEDVKPFVEPGSIFEQLVRYGGRLGAVEARAGEPPAPFRDSPGAVRIFAEQGEDFISGDTHANLEAQTLSTGETAWRLSAGGVEYTTPFAALGG